MSVLIMGKPVALRRGSKPYVSCTNLNGPVPIICLVQDRASAFVPTGEWDEAEFFNFTKTTLARYGHDSLTKAIINCAEGSLGVLKIQSVRGEPQEAVLVHFYERLRLP